MGSTLINIIGMTHDYVRETGDEISKRLDHLVPVLCCLEVLARFSVAFLDSLDPEAQRGRRRNRLSPNHIPVDGNGTDDKRLYYYIVINIDIDDVPLYIITSRSYVVVVTRI